MRNGRVRVFLLRRRAVAAVGALVLAGAIFWAVSRVERMASSTWRYSSILSASTFSFAFRAAFSL